MRRCHERCKEVIRETSRIRDIDILRERISGHSKDAIVALMLNNFQEEREEFVDRIEEGRVEALRAPPAQTREARPAEVRPPRRDRPGQAQRRIETELRVAVGDESKVDELHSLRKHLKRLRYTLELFPSVERHSRLVADLRRWQAVLGEIRDGDVVLDYLSLARPTGAVRKAIASERALRHRRYVSFVNSSRRRPIGRPVRFADPGEEKASAARSGP